MWKFFFLYFWPTGWFVFWLQNSLFFLRQLKTKVQKLGSSCRLYAILLALVPSDISTPHLTCQNEQLSMSYKPIQDTNLGTHE